MYLGGDIGGTKTLLALADGDGRLLIERRYASRDFPDFDAVLSVFLDEARQAGLTASIASACFGVAGPVVQGRAQLTYLPWLMDSATLATRHGLGRVRLANDFEAVASAVPGLSPDQYVTLQAGDPQEQAPKAVLGAGTGLGVASLVWHGQAYSVIPGEGGHMGFSPRDEDEDELARALRAELGRVTAETVVSGPGLARIHRHFTGQAEDPAAISAAALAGNPDALRSVGLFLRAYGDFAGDLGLLLMARGGVWLAGGIAPKLLPLFERAGFLNAFNAKGCHAHLAASLPVHVVTEERLGLLGALALARA